ncbi:hypothetical protein GE09DRAFT_731898 [Coniochaeta sp. 2T2.1]|nr:hypothetical protein GE09DRAFT_731898 [Coniochaeta sp. 2T2.1]
MRCIRRWCHTRVRSWLRRFTARVQVTVVVLKAASISTFLASAPRSSSGSPISGRYPSVGEVPDLVRDPTTRPEVPCPQCCLFLARSVCLGANLIFKIRTSSDGAIFLLRPGNLHRMPRVSPIISRLGRGTNARARPQATCGVAQLWLLQFWGGDPAVATPTSRLEYA